MNPGTLLMSGMKSSCTRRAASLESVTPSYRRTVKYALLLMVIILRVTYVSCTPSRALQEGRPYALLYHKKVALQGRFGARLCFQWQLAPRPKNCRAAKARVSSALPTHARARGPGRFQARAVHWLGCA